MATGRCPEFVIESGDGAAPDRIAAALTPRFTVVQEARRRERQVWLDTFDWRLHAAGLELRQLNGGLPSELVLTTATGEPVAAQPLPAARWPALPGGLPDGPLRDRLLPVAGVRALLPQARAEGTVTRLRVLDGERKTVARIQLQDAALATPGAAALPARLVLTPVRGYQGATDRAARLLAAADGFAPSSRSAYETMLASAGHQPGPAKGAALAAATPARTALAATLLGLADTIEVNAAYVIRDVDIEFLHDLRVAVRRIRSVLKLAGDVLPRGFTGQFAGEFKWLGDLTTPVRDLDVHLAGFGATAARLAAAAPADLEPLRAELARRRRTERTRLVRGLRSARFSGLLAAWRAALREIVNRPAGRKRPAGADAATGGAAGRKRAVGPGSGPDTGTLAADRISRAYRRVVKRGAALSPAPDGGGPPAADLHALRKRGKELRYLLEFFGSLYEPAALRRAVKDLKGLQDCLGVFQDAEVQQDGIREFATAMLASRPAFSPGTSRAARPDAATLAATLLAMGELTAALHADQARARAEVSGRFAEFAGAGLLRTLGLAGRVAQA